MLIAKNASGDAFDIDGNTPLTDTLRAIASKGDGSVDSALQKLWAYLDGSITAGSKSGGVIKSVILKLATTNDELKAALEGPVGMFLLDQHAGSGLPSLRKLRDAGSPLNYVMSSKRAVKTKRGDVTLGAQSDAKLSATIEVLKSSNSELRPPLEFGQNDAILHASVAGFVDVEGSFKVPFNGGSANGKAGAGASMALNAYYQWPGDSTIASALVDSVSEIVAPWDLDSVDQQLAQPKPNGEWRGLRRISVDATGRLDLSGSITAGYTWAFDGINSYNGADISAGASISGGLSVGWSRFGQFRICVERLHPDQSIRVSVAKLDKGGRQFGFDLTAEISIKGLGDIAQPIVDRLVPDEGDLLKKLQKWTAPGTVLIDKMQGAIGTDDPAVKMLTDLLLGRASSEDAVARVKALVLAEIKEQVNTALPFWANLDDTDALAASLGQMIAQRFGTEADTTKALVDSIASWIDEPINTIKSELEADLDKIVTDASGSLKGLFSVFASIGEDVNALAVQANAAASNVLAPAIKLLTFYEEARAKIVKALTAASDIKLGLALKAVYSKNRTNNVELAFTIREVTPRTTLLYRSLLTGRLDSLWDILEQARTAGEVDEIEGIFSSTVNRSRSLSLSLNFGSHGIAWTRSNLSEARVDVDASGTISIASGKFSSSTTAKAFGESSGAGMIGSINFAAALSDPQAALPLTLGFDFNYEDKKMTPQELNKYLSSFNPSGFTRPLLSSEAIEHALDVYGDQPQRATIGSAVSLNILTLQAVIVGSATTQGATRILNTARSALVAVGAADLSIATLRALAESTDPRVIAGLIGDFDGLNEEQLSLRFKAKTQMPLPTTGPNSPAARLYRNIRAINLLSNGLLDSLRAMGGAGSAFATAKATAATLASIPDRQKIYFEAIDNINARINHGLAGWFRQFDWVNRAPAFAVALLATLAELANDDDFLLVPIARIGASEGTLRILAF